MLTCFGAIVISTDGNEFPLVTGFPCIPFDDLSFFLRARQNRQIATVHSMNRGTATLGIRMAYNPDPVEDTAVKQHKASVSKFYIKHRQLCAGLCKFSIRLRLAAVEITISKLQLQSPNSSR